VTALPDDELLTAVVAGEDGAWPELMRRYQRLLVGCVRKALRRYRVFVSEDDIEDVVATVHVNLVKDDYKKLRSFDPTRGYRLSSWIGLIATTTALDALRRRAPDHTSLDGDGEGGIDAPVVVDDAPSASDTLESQERWRALLGAINELGEADREFLRLYYDEELEPEALAARLGISVATVYSRKNKVAAKLRRIVAKDGPKDGEDP
jgi:RNA polymerase sigma-70 factor (ECF subfamily)